MSTDQTELMSRIDEVYSAVMWLTRLVIGLIVLIVIKIILSGMLHKRFRNMFARIDAILDLAERHGGMTDQQQATTRKQVAAVTRGITKVIDERVKEIKIEVPVITAEKLAERTSESGIQQSNIKGEQNV